MTTYPITSGYLRIDDLRSVLNETFHLQLADEAKLKMQVCRDYLEKKIAEPGRRYYGINTGFGALCDVEISNDQLEQLQENLLMSHACGMGTEVMPEVVKIMLILKMKGL